MDSTSQAPKLFFIYKITNLINKKIYIGKTSKDNPYVRWYNHSKFPYYESTKDNCPKLYNAIRKYGIENFTFEVIDSFETESEAYQAEENLVEKLDTIKNGMNTVPGGFGTSSGEKNQMYGKGYLISGEKNGMFGMTGNKNPFYGKEHSTEFIVAIKKQNRVLSDDQVRDIKIMISNKINYNIIAAKFNIVLATISRIKHGHRYADIS